MRKFSLTSLYPEAKHLIEDQVDTVIKLVVRYFELNISGSNRNTLAKRFVDTEAGQCANIVRKLAQPTLIIRGD
jgi:hypothetical protein